MNLKGKKVTVVGLGISGLSAAKLLFRSGAKVSVTDNGNSPDLSKTKELLNGMGIEVEIGAHTEGFIKDRELVIVSPGVDKNALPILWAKKNGIPIIGEIELASYFCKAPIAAITGSNGKTTVTTMTGEILKAGGKNTYVCGNIGLPFCDVAMDARADDVIVLEVSSFQLAGTVNFKPNAAIILNVTGNHLDKHDSMKDYLETKFRIFKNQGKGDWTILNYDDPVLRGVGATFMTPVGAGRINPTPTKGLTSDVMYFSRFKKVKGAFIDGDGIFLNINGTGVRICSKSEICLKGEHNIENILASALAGSYFNIAPEVIRKVVTGFKGLPHRFEYVDSKDGVTFINDSKSTSVGAALRALEAIESPVLLIAGGRDKGSDFTLIKDLVREKVKKVVLLGEASSKIRKSLDGATNFKEANSMAEAVQYAYDSAVKGDCILLSPMCASFDMFRNFEERGEEFKKSVRRICDRPE